MKYKPAVFAVHTDGKTPTVSEGLFDFAVCATFAYDLDNMACIVFAVLKDDVNEETLRPQIPFYFDYVIDEIKYKEYYENLQDLLDRMNGIKENPVLTELGGNL